MSEERRARLWVQYADDIRKFQRGHPGLWQEFREIEEDRTVDHEECSRARVPGGKGHRGAGGRNPLDQGRRPPDPRHPGSGAQTAHEEGDKRADRPRAGCRPRAGAMAGPRRPRGGDGESRASRVTGGPRTPGRPWLLAPERISTPGAPGRGTTIFVTGAAAWG